MIILFHAKDESDCVSLADNLVKYLGTNCIRISEKHFIETLSDKKLCNFRFSGLDMAVFLSREGFIPLISCKTLDQFDIIWMCQKTKVYEIHLYNSKQELESRNDTIQEADKYKLLQIDTSEKYNLSLSKIKKLLGL